MRKFTRKIALAFGATLLAAGLNTTKAQTGAALNFDATGPNDNVVLNSAIATNSLVGQNKITVEAWVRPTTLTGLGVIVGNYSTPSNQMQFLLRRDNSTYVFYVGAGNITSYNGVQTAANTATTGAWQHVAGVYDGTVISVYINGALSASINAVPNYTFAASTNSIIVGGNSIGENYTGDIDELRIWNVARTQCQLNTFKNCEIPTNATNLVANYHFNQGTAASSNATVTTLNDATSNAYNGTLNNFALTGATGNWVTPGGVVSGFTTALAPPSLTVTANPSLAVCANNTLILTASGASTYTWTGLVTNAVAFTPTASNVYTVTATVAATGCTNTAVASVTANSCPGEALNFDGVNDVVNCGSVISNSLANSPVLTVETWIRPAVLTGTGAIVNNHSGGTQFCLRRTGNFYQFFIGFGSYSVLTPAATSTANVWQHVAAVLNQSVMTVYINGVLSTTSVIPSYSLTATSPQVQIGNDGFSEAFNGNIDEVRIWKSARTQCEINTYMNCEIPANATNLLANYHFNQGVAFSPNATVTVLNDATSAANNGTLTSMALSGITSNWVSPGGVAAGYTTSVAAPGYTNTALAICPTGTVVLGGTNVTSYSWTPTLTNNAPFTPSVSTSYSFAGTNSVTSCSVSGVANVTVNPNPTVTAVSSQTNIICVGQSATLTAGGANTYVWNTTATTAVVAISPTVTTSYTVTGTNSNGCSNVATVTQSVSACTGIVNQVSSVNLEIYPNPSTGIFNIKADSEMTIEVFDMLGSLILKTDINSVEYKLNLGEQNKGLYIVKCTSQGLVKSYRLIKD
jgi:hypothetical protein